MIKAVIFDLDGVLVNATEWHYEALNKALSVFGFSINQDDHNNTYNGLPTAEKLKLFSTNHNFPSGLHEIVKRLKRKYTDEIINQRCRPNHAKQLLLSSLKKQGYKIACCSNAQKYAVLNMLKISQIDNFFELILGNDEGYKNKPAPDIYIAAFEKLGITAQEAIIIEDAPHGIEAGKASGAQVIAVRGYDDVNLSLFENLNLLNNIVSTPKTELKLDQFTKGWLVGDFSPVLFNSKDIEIGVKKYKQGDKESRHVHKIITEYTVIISGKFKMNNNIISENDIVVIKPGESTDFECLEDGSNLVIKTPSIPNDKYVINIENNNE